jgi:hypothetical protein
MSEDLDEYLHNLEIVICGISDVMDERWTCWPSRHILQLIDMLCSHVIAQYELGMCAVPGGDVRQRILSIILHIFAHPTTGQLGEYISTILMILYCQAKMVTMVMDLSTVHLLYVLMSTIRLLAISANTFNTLNGRELQN